MVCVRHYSNGLSCLYRLRLLNIRIYYVLKLLPTYAEDTSEQSPEETVQTSEKK
jgi:hypothetical protein